MKHTVIMKKTLSLILTFCMLLGLMPGLSLSASAVGDVYPIYVITQDATNHYSVNKETSEAGGFSVFTGTKAIGGAYYSSLLDASADISSDVGTGSATVYFGSIGSTDQNATVTMDTNIAINFSRGGTYTIKGSLSGSTSGISVLAATDSTSLIIEGATLSCAGILNEGSGTVTVNSGIIAGGTWNGIANQGSGSLIINGGKISSGSNFAIANSGDGKITISGDEWDDSSKTGTLVQGGAWGVLQTSGTLQIDGGTIIGSGYAGATDSGNCALFVNGSACQTYINGGTIKKTGTSGYGIGLNTAKNLHLSGTPSISGPTADIYTSKPIYASNDTASYTGKALTIDYSPAADDPIVPGTTVVVTYVTEGVNDTKFTLVNDGYYLALNDIDLIISTSTTPADNTVYPVYVITQDEGTSTYHYYVKKETSKAGGFAAFTGTGAVGLAYYSSPSLALADISSDVAAGSATVYFGSTSSTDQIVTGAMNISDTNGILGDFSGGGTYTIKGSMSTTNEELKVTNATSLIIDGVTSSGVIFANDGSGTITVNSGIIANTMIAAIANDGSGNLIINGGKITAATASAIAVGGSGKTTISGNEWDETSKTGTLVQGARGVGQTGGTLQIDGGTIIGTGNTGTGGPGNCAVWVNGTTSLTYINGGTIKNTATGGYGIRLDSAENLHLSGTPSISGPTAGIYTSKPIYASNNTASYTGNALTIDYSPAANDPIVPGTTVVVSNVTKGTNDTKFTLVNDGYSLALSGTNLIINAGTTPADSTVYPVYVITQDEGTSTYHYYVKKETSKAGGFAAFTGTNAYGNAYYSALHYALSDICSDVGTGSATVYFGCTGSTNQNVTGAMIIGNEAGNFSGGGTYTIMGRLSGTSCRLTATGATSLIIDGATISGVFIENEGSGTITVNSGTLTNDDFNAIANEGSGSLIINGGKITSGCDVVVNSGSGNLTISGDEWDDSSQTGTLVQGPWGVVQAGGTLQIDGGTIIGSGYASATLIPTTNALYVQGSTSLTYISGGTIKNTATSGYGIQLTTAKNLHLSGTPSISGPTADIYTSKPIYASNGTASYTGKALTIDYSPAADDPIVPGTTVVVSNVTKGTNDTKFTLVNDGYSLALSGTNLIINAGSTPADNTVYPYYCITKNASSGYDVHKRTESGKPFSAVSTGVALDDAISAITTEVGSGAATLAFGNTFDETSGTVSGTLNIGSGGIDLGSEGSYTVTGSLSGTGLSNTLISISGASMTVAGASLSSEGVTINKSVSGNVTVSSGSVESSKLYALLSNGGPATISGGTVSSGSGICAVYDHGSDTVTVSGGTVSCPGGFGISSKGTVKVTGGNISGESAVSAMTAVISGGTLTGNESPALVCAGAGSTITGGTLTSANPTTTFVLTDGYFPGTVLVTDLGNTAGKNADLTISGGVISNTASGGYAVCCCDYTAVKNDAGTTAKLYLSGTPSLSGSVSLATNTAVYAASGSGASYTGAILPLYYNGSITPGTTVAVANVTSGTNDKLFSLTNDGLGLFRNDTNLIIGTAPAAPTGQSGIAPTSKTGTDGAISGTTVSMEYKLASSSGGYTACTDGSTTVGAAGDYLVRYAVTGTSAASKASTVTVPAYSTYSVTGIVKDSSGSFVSGALVKIMQGKTQIGVSVTTNSNGEFIILNVPDGEYNLIVTKSPHTVTKFITVSGTNYSAGVIVLPTSEKNSVLDVTGSDTPNVVVNGLDQEAQTQSENSCTVTMTIAKKASDDSAIASDASAIAILAGSQTVEYLKIDVTKTTSSGSTALTSLSTVQEMVIPYDFSGKNNVTVYRYHGVAAFALTALNSRPADLSSALDGSFYADSANGMLYVYANQFSTYAVGYSTITGTNYVSPSATSYPITVSTGTGGSISPSGTVNVTHGSDKTFTITANNGYTVSDVLVDGKSVGAVTSYTFSSVTASHTISAVFTTSSGLPYYLGADGNKVFVGFASDKSGTMKYIAPDGKTVLFIPNPKSFTDISGHWAKSYIDFVTEREIFVGTGDNAFSPDTGMTRAMFATVIGRLYERSYGALTASDTHAFTDCNYDSWYGKYIDWCSKNNIIEGIGGGHFEPDREITRQEMAAILYRFAAFLKVSGERSGTLLSYPDSADIASWAQDAALYCQQTGMIVGRVGGRFAPQETATRAEVATILKRFIETVV